MKNRPGYNPMMKKLYLDIVENQLRHNNPPETRKTYDRLRNEGISEDDVKLLIASVIAAETFDIVRSEEPFDRERFVRDLDRLPDQSFLDE